MTTVHLVDRHPLKEKRRANKPLLERKRRKRINDSLADLKRLVLTSLNKDVSKYAKMEKVDILDMTVQFLKGNTIDHREEDYANVYRSGYQDSRKQTYQSIMTMDGIEHSVKCKILSMLSTSINFNNMYNSNSGRATMDITSPPPSPTLSNEPLSPLTPSSHPIHYHHHHHQQQRIQTFYGTNPTNTLPGQCLGRMSGLYYPRQDLQSSTTTTTIKFPAEYTNQKQSEQNFSNVIKPQVWRPW